MHWLAPAIVLGTHPFGESDALASVFGAECGLYRGLARGAAGRRGAAVWQRGNLLSVRWVARLAEQLGSFSAELIHPTAALAMDNALQLAMLNALTALVEGAIPEREPQPETFAGLLRLITQLDLGAALLPDLVRWESGLLASLGYGLDFSGGGDTMDGGLAFVSPRTGRAVSEAVAGPWRDRLLRLPAFLLADAPSAPADWCDGLRLTGHFLARDVFGSRHKPLPEARLHLYDLVSAMIDTKKRLA